MATHDYVIDNAAGSTVRSDINSALSAIVSNNSNATAPSTTYAYQWWADTTTGLLKLRNAANSAWVTIGTLASTYLGLLPLAGGTLTAGLNFAPTVTVASATTADIGAAAANSVLISGTTTITGFGTVAAGVEREVTFVGILTLTHNATSLILPGGANITTAAGDALKALSLGSGNWRVTRYTKASGAAVVSSAADFVHLKNTAPDGTMHGNTAAATWTARGYTLTLGYGWTEIADAAAQATVDYSNKQFTLAAGTWDFTSRSTFSGAVGGIRMRLYNVTDAAATLSNSLTGSNGAALTYALNYPMPLFGRFVIAGTKTFELQYFARAAVTNGLGEHDGMTAGEEIYDEIIAYRIS